MENIRYIPQGQARGVNYKTSRIIKFIKKNKVALIIGSASLGILTTYIVLINTFISLLMTL